MLDESIKYVRGILKQPKCGIALYTIMSPRGRSYWSLCPGGTLVQLTVILLKCSKSGWICFLRYAYSKKHTLNIAIVHVQRFYTFPVSIGMSSISRADLQSSIDLSAVEHEDVVVEVSQSRLPGDEVYFLGQIFCGSQGQCCWDYSGSADREQIRCVLCRHMKCDRRNTYLLSFTLLGWTHRRWSVLCWWSIKPERNDTQKNKQTCQEGVVRQTKKLQLSFLISWYPGIMTGD